MSIVVFGLSHRTAPLDLLERCSVPAGDVPKRLADLHGRDHLSEAVLVSTCNRTEIFVVAEKFHAAYGELRAFLSDSADVPYEHYADHLYVMHDDEAVRHLFSVSAGLDSAVLGESEILGQIKSAWETARIEGTTGPVLNLLFRHALETGKRARTETAIGRHIASVSHAAVAMANERLCTLQGSRVLIVGAGEMAEGMVVALADAGPAEVLVANRTPDRAAALAQRVGGRAVPLEDLPVELASVDVLLTSTGATSVILDQTSFEGLVARREGSELLVVDIALPRDVDPEVGELEGVTLLDMDDLASFADRGRAEREREVDDVSGIIDHEVQRFADVRSAREMAPLISSLRGQAETVRLAELDRFRTQLGSLDDQQRQVVESITSALVAKILHEPTVRLKDAAGSAKGDRLADSVRDLFDL